MEAFEKKEQSAPTETTPASPTIADLARSCLERFQKCLNKAADVHPRELTLVENQVARFSVWAANIGVFAPGRGSLDHRLREAPDVQDAVGGLLEALGLRALSCLEILTSLSLKVSEQSLEAVDPSFDHVLEGVSKDISLLHRLSNTGRRASKDMHKKKVASAFRIRDEQGNDVESFLEALFAHNVRDQFPGTSEAIQQRLAKTMLLRRKTILYRRSRYGKTPTRTREKPVQPVASQPRVRCQPGQNLPQVTTTAQEAEAPDETAKSVARSAAVTATTLAPDHFKKASTPSVVSRSKTVALSSHADLRFPPAPCGALTRKHNKFKAKREANLAIVVKEIEAKGEQVDGASRGVETRIGKSGFNTVADAEAAHREALKAHWEECLKELEEIVCPFCFCTLPVSEVVDEKKWREHVKSDLDPYVCLFEECDSGEELYAHSRPWLKHMREHTLRWSCKSKSHGPFTASSRADYLNHMQESHAGKFTEAQLGVLADRNGRATGTLFQTCPLCGTDEVGNLDDHIIGHMRALALKSLPSYEEDDEAHYHSESQQSSGSSAKAPSRSTLKNDGWDVWSSTDDTTTPNGEQPDTFASTTQDQVSPDSPDPELPTLFHQDEARGVLPMADYSRIFSGIPRNDHRLFEWGFIAAIRGSPIDPENDPIMYAFRRQRYALPSWLGIDPDCAVCGAPAGLMCDCEARALDESVVQAENRMMFPIYSDIRSWVRGKSQDYVLRTFNRSCGIEQDLPGAERKVPPAEGETPSLSQSMGDALLQPRGEEDVTPGELNHIKASPSDNQSFSRVVQERHLRPRLEGKSRNEVSDQSQPPRAAITLQKHEVDQRWQEVWQRFPEVLEYHFSLLEVHLPPDDDPNVSDPPLTTIPKESRDQKKANYAGIWGKASTGDKFQPFS
ncbi:serine/threonine protein phosphatase [Colletotrichum higginsianum]|uniref:Serine/threonine protein phosphatase n=1 Tax=Colletotrichum higginsianum (strain IMI 349063) TaxID=759273 RepID=H1VPW3_COLHI|nr:Serine/threonine protein phosphatase [Colletotrichum higginsianum IMI 349063]OBR03251.1 Serine/threonine protein phosphatase [Colletotrichum higginsianum IMI 349063]CCF42269.1 serine/threonine protein phosphatase [Colletotrichum higginsianum]